MRGTDQDESTMFSYVSPEARIPADHPLRVTRELANRALDRLDRKFRKLYSRTGRPSVPPEQLLRALLIQVLYSIRSERMLMEQLEYNLLFRWFVGLEMDDRVWDVTVFTKNRNRLREGEVAESFFQAVLEQARDAGLLSDEHFTVDGTLIEAWAGHKSFRPKDKDGTGPGGGRPSGLGCDKNYDTQDQVDALRALGVTPHVAQNNRNRRSAIDDRTTTHTAYEVSQRKRKCVEQVFGWGKMVGPIRKAKHRGRQRVGWMFTFTQAAYNLVRMRPLLCPT